MIEFKNEDRLIVYRSLACETQKKNEAQRRGAAIILGFRKRGGII
jgi:hypothetical protein